MIPSVTILGYINKLNGVQKLQYLSVLKQIFITASGALTTLGNANGAAILALTNQLSNEEFGYQDKIDPIWTLFAAALLTLGQNAHAAVISNYQIGRASCRERV